MLLAAGTLHAQTGTAASVAIPRQRIEGLLQVKLPGAPQETGGGLFDGTGYRIGALKRKLPGEVEIHGEDTDIIYILSGRATLTTGGSAVGKHAISAIEERGTAIRNGVVHQLATGDMVVIPKQQPHWFQQIAGQVSYIVVKVK